VDSRLGAACGDRFDPATEPLHQTTPTLCDFGGALLLEPCDDRIACGSVISPQVVLTDAEFSYYLPERDGISSQLEGAQLPRDAFSKLRWDATALRASRTQWCSGSQLRMGCVSQKDASDRAAEDLGDLNDSLQWRATSMVRPTVHRRFVETDAVGHPRKSAFEVPTCASDQKL
jgi:hypothetical protein